MDPNRDYYRYGLGTGLGIFQAFAPTGAVGIFAGFIILLLLGIGSGFFDGVWIVAAVLAIAGLVLLIARSIRRELRRDDRPPRPLHPQASSLPADADLTDDERRDAMRRFDSR